MCGDGGLCLLTVVSYSKNIFFMHLTCYRVCFNVLEAEVSSWPLEGLEIHFLFFVVAWMCGMAPWE